MFGIVWLPYILIILYNFSYTKKRIHAASIIVMSALLGYRLPIMGGLHIPMLFAGSVTLIIYILLQGPSNKFSLRGDKSLIQMVIIYSVIHFLSVLFNYEESVTLPTYVIRLFGYFPLFLICLVSINTRSDIDILCKYIMVGGILMAIIGIGQFYFNDSLWGIQSTRKTGGVYGEYFTESLNVGYGSLIGFRVSSSASNPNSFSAVMCMTLMISLYKLKVFQKNKFVILIKIGIIIQLIALVLSGSRAGVITLFMLFIVRIVLLARKKNNVKKVLRSLLTVTAICTVMLTILLSNPYYKKEILSRYNKIFTTGETGFIKGSNRLNRAWIPYIMRIRPEMFLIGYGTPGIPSDEDQEQMSRTTHNDLLAVLYFNGFWGLLAFLLILARYFLIVKLIYNTDLKYALILSMTAYVIFGISSESFLHKGQPYIFWPLLAIAARFRVINSHKQIRKAVL